MSDERSNRELCEHHLQAARLAMSTPGATVSAAANTHATLAVLYELRAQRDEAAAAYNAAHEIRRDRPTFPGDPRRFPL